MLNRRTRQVELLIPTSVHSVIDHTSGAAMHEPEWRESVPIDRVNDSGPQLAEEAIVAAEKELGFALPAQYRTFLLRHNGGRVKPDTFKFAGSDRGATLQPFFRIGDPRPFSDLVGMAKHALTRVPPDLTPIAPTQGGDLVCIGVRGERLGKIYNWGHDEPRPENDPTYYGNVRLIADSFDAFVEGLHEAEEDDDAT